MPVIDPRAGRAFIWAISWFLFLTIAGGGGCLVMYMILPETTTTSWLPIVGITLVCLPWFFWLSTFLYRILSRVFGFRLGIDGSNGNNVVEEEAVAAAATSVYDQSNSPAETPALIAARRVQFEALVTVHENDENEDQDKHKDSIVSPSSSINSSVMSHESEMPLASSMAS
ncbi:hypothetical protein PanWU01x14_312100 [Parasponia andersonii]|uniref:Transmembrane protein n=1 Tax=Parasponia andersonii TaxID=3476 RepID=A0A2P5APP4_PARAD|nr:hypothetical protein PanWU01x14_312100 [Parasponia andersonii]